MVELYDLWLPILVAAVFVFVVSSLVHMALRLHKGDYRKLPGEDAVLEAMRSQGVQRGTYMFPCPGSMKDMGSPEMVERYRRGPVGTMIVLPSGPPQIGKNLVQWFLFSVLVGVLVAYVASVGLTRTAATADVVRLTSTAAFLGYGASYFVDSIWKGLPWNLTAKYLFDGLLYALATAAAFAWLWPGS